MAANKMETRKPIQYFVFMKAQTTGRQWEESTKEKTKIVELSLIAVNRLDLERGVPKKMPAAHKMNMVFCPERDIQCDATSAHDLTNCDVQNALSFKQSAGSIIAFLQQFPKPVCLVAHTGFSFDYKHLQGECIEAGIQLPHDLLCADAKYIFHHILKTPINKKPRVRLIDLHLTFFGVKVDPVTAEEMSLILLDCALVKIHKFIDLAETKCKLFSEVLPVGVYKLGKCDAKELLEKIKSPY